MNKQEFLRKLQARLGSLPPREREERVAFFSEMIDDRIEEGLTEREAVLLVGSLDELAADLPGEREEKEVPHFPDTGKRVWRTVLVVFGFPIWFSLAASAFAVAVSLLAAIWSIVVSLFAVFVSCPVGALGGIVGGVIVAVSGSYFSGLAFLGVGLLLAGLTFPVLLGCLAAVRGACRLSRLTVRGTVAIFRVCF